MDLVTETDKAAERAIIERLRASHPVRGRRDGRAGGRVVGQLLDYHKPKQWPRLSGIQMPLPLDQGPFTAKHIDCRREDRQTDRQAAVEEPLAIDPSSQGRQIPNNSAMAHCYCGIIGNHLSVPGAGLIVSGNLMFSGDDVLSFALLPSHPCSMAFR